MLFSDGLGLWGCRGASTFEEEPAPTWDSLRTSSCATVVARGPSTFEEKPTTPLAPPAMSETSTFEEELAAEAARWLFCTPLAEAKRGSMTTGDPSVQTPEAQGAGGPPTF